MKKRHLYIPPTYNSSVVVSGFNWRSLQAIGRFIIARLDLARLCLALVLDDLFGFVVRNLI